MNQHQKSFCGRVSRRGFVSELGMGFGGLALGSMLQRDGRARAGQLTADEKLVREFRRERKMSFGFFFRVASAIWKRSIPSRF